MIKYNATSKKILIVDDSDMNRAILSEMLNNEYEIIEAENGVEAISVLRRRSEEIDLVLLDIVMPEMDGFEVLTHMNNYHWIDSVPVIMISSEKESASIQRAYDLGVTDYINRPFDSFVVHRRIENTIMLYAKQKKLADMLAEQFYEREKNNNMMVDVLSHIVEFRNGESGLHVHHIHVITELLLKQLQTKPEFRSKISQSDIQLISMASAFHDIGKIGISSEILNKPGRLTTEEFEEMKKHTVIGAAMLTEMKGYKDEPLIKMAYEICRWHHERYDGRGYPDGLKGDDIPISAQIVAMADVYDALTSERCYKKAFSHEKAMEMIRNGECGVFQPVLVECLTEAQDRIRIELNEVSIGSQNQKSLHSITKIIEQSHSSELGGSFSLIEMELERAKFFYNHVEEIQFDYDAKSSTVTVSEWGMKRLGINEPSFDPYKADSHVANSESMHIISDHLHNTTREDPVVTVELPLNIGGEQRWHKIVAKARWSNDDEPVYLGAIGIAMDIHEKVTSRQSNE